MDKQEQERQRCFTEIIDLFQEAAQRHLQNSNEDKLFFMLVINNEDARAIVHGEQRTMAHALAQVFKKAIGVRKVIHEAYMDEALTDLFEQDAEEITAAEIDNEQDKPNN